MCHIVRARGRQVESVIDPSGKGTILGHSRQERGLILSPLTVVGYTPYFSEKTPIPNHVTVDAGLFVTDGSRCMPRTFLSRRAWLNAVLALLGTTAASGCGTILYPERKGQPSGQIDWKIVALDGLGLLFFFIPGVIAFAVDFNNGTIYLPPEDCVDRDWKADGKPLISRRIPRGELSRPGLEALVSEHVRRPIELAPGRYESRRLNHLDDFWSTHDELKNGSFS